MFEVIQIQQWTKHVKISVLMDFTFSAQSDEDQQTGRMQKPEYHS